MNGDTYQFPSADVTRLLATVRHETLFDVKYVIAPEPLEDPQLVLRQTLRWEGHGEHEEEGQRGDARDFAQNRGAEWDGTVYIYEARPTPHAFLVDDDFRAETPPRDPVPFEVTFFSPMRIELNGLAPAAGTLFVSEPFYPGWKATVDGQPTAIVRLDGGFEGVKVGQGTHSIVLYYDPASFKVGFWISTLAMALIILRTAVPARRA